MKTNKQTTVTIDKSVFLNLFNACQFLANIQGDRIDQSEFFQARDKAFIALNSANTVPFEVHSKFGK